VGLSPGQSLRLSRSVKTVQRRRASFAVGGWPFPRRGFPRPAPMRSSFRCPRSLVPSPPLRRPSGSLATLAHLPAEADPWSRVPLLEFLKDRPSTDMTVCVHSRLPEVRGCHTRTRSALVVLPDFGGLLRTRLAGLLHPATGPGVHPVSCRRPGSHQRPDIPPDVASPSKSSSFAAGGLSPGSLPPRRSSLEPKSHVRRPRGLAPRASPAPSVSPPPVHRTPLGFPRSWLSPERPALAGLRPCGRSCRTRSRVRLSRGLPQAGRSRDPTSRSRGGFSRTAAAVLGAGTFPSRPLRARPVAPETRTGFLTVPLRSPASRVGCHQRSRRRPDPS